MTHTYLDTIAGVSFYEHGTRGDEAQIIVKVNGKFAFSGLYDLPDFYEARDMKKRLATIQPDASIDEMHEIIRGY